MTNIICAKNQEGAWSILVIILYSDDHYDAYGDYFDYNDYLDMLKNGRAI